MLTRSTGENSVSAYSYSQTVINPDDGPSHTTAAESPLFHLVGCLKTHNSIRVLVKQKYLIKSVMLHDLQSK